MISSSKFVGTRILAGCTVLLGLYFGMLVGPLYLGLLTDYYMLLGLVSMFGAFVVILPAALLFFWSTVIRRYFTKEESFLPGHLLLISFSSVCGYYFLSWLSARIFSMDNSARSLGKFFLLHAALYIASLFCTHLLHLYCLRLKKLRLGNAWTIIVILAVMFFGLAKATTPPSAHDVCKKIAKNEERQKVVTLLDSYRILLSRQQDPSADYSYHEDNSGFFILSPGLYCVVDMKEGVVTNVVIIADSF